MKYKILTTLILLIHSCNYAQNYDLSSFVKPGSPLYIGNYAKNSRTHISYQGSLKGEMLYNDQLIKLDSFYIRNNILSDKINKIEYSLRSAKLKQLSFSNTEGHKLILFRIFPKKESMYRELWHDDNIIIYDNYLVFDTSIIDKYNMVVYYKGEYYNIPKNKKRRQRVIENTFNDFDVKSTIENWCLKNM